MPPTNNDAPRVRAGPVSSGARGQPSPRRWRLPRASPSLLWSDRRASQTFRCTVSGAQCRPHVFPIVQCRGRSARVAETPSGRPARVAGTPARPAQSCRCIRSSSTGPARFFSIPKAFLEEGVRFDINANVLLIGHDIAAREHRGDPRHFHCRMAGVSRFFAVSYSDVKKNGGHPERTAAPTHRTSSKFSGPCEF